ncbi:acyltransferase [Polycladomyces sp. WAk]|uniref:Acyltransferase n=1 Tax=Polycladomyces zharkentensis TaxID=2807616 RepID=A0ABS2WKS8_9BACL|nr:nitrilase-related carbon-nitrogen hydrolase [Polycladomyces sp. WAk]MBN2910134.1 acyltransferase [Polycladomyces sp. WAk]
MRIGLAQIRPVLGRLDRNLALHREMIRQAKENQVDLVIFPELSLTGYQLQDLTYEVARTMDHPEIRELVALSEEMDLVFGMVEESPDHILYNAGVYASGGRIVHVHRKVYLPTYGMFDEARYFGRGRSIRSFDTRFGRMGMLICEDMWHVSAPYLLAQDGAEWLIVLSNSPARRVGSEGLGSEQVWHRLLSTHAMLQGSYVFFAHRVGVEDGVTFFGGSMAYDPFGRLIKQGALFDPDLVLVDVKPDQIRRARFQMPMLRDEDVELTARELNRILARRTEEGSRS